MTICDVKGSECHVRARAAQALFAYKESEAQMA